MRSQIPEALLRQLLTVGGTFLATRGFTDHKLWASALGVVLVLFSVLWSLCHAMAANLAPEASGKAGVPGMPPLQPGPAPGPVPAQGEAAPSHPAAAAPLSSKETPEPKKP